jgi:hypothetical protein
LTSDRAGYLDKLNVSGALANTDNASSFGASVDDIAYAVWSDAISDYNFEGAAGAALINAGVSTDLAPVLDAIALIPTNPLLVTDARLNDLATIKAKTNQLVFSGGDIVATLAGEEVVVSTASVNAIVAGVNGVLTIPTAVQIRQEIDSNSTQLAEIKAAANAAKALSAAGL